MKYLGDYAEDYATLNLKFSTHQADGTPITLAGTPAVSVYKANGTTQSTAGITLTLDFDAVTGLHNVLIDLSADAFYAVANDYAVVITAGTVDGVSVVGTVLAHFSIQNRSTSAIKTDTAAILADTGTDGVVVAAGSKSGYALTATTGLGNQTANITGTLSGSVGSVTGAVGSVTGAVGSIASGGITAASLDATVQARLGIVAFGTAQAATGTTLQLAAASTFADDELIGAVIVITGGSTGVGQSRVITDNVGSTDTVTVDTWTITPTGTITYVVFAAPPASATAIPSVNIAKVNNVAIIGDGSATPFNVA